MSKTVEHSTANPSKLQPVSLTEASTDTVSVHQRVAGN